MWNKKAVYGFVFLLLGILSAFTLLSKPVHATGGINPVVSFEGKIVNKTSGVNIADATYNMEFKIYSGPSSTGSGDTLLWTEDWLVGSTQGGIALTSGTYQVNLGTAGSGDSVALSSLNWNQYPLWLSVQIGNSSSCTITTTFTSNCGGDGEMSPYILLASTPYALNAGELGGLSSTSFGQLAANQTWTGSNVIQDTATNALQVENGSNLVLLTANTSSGSVLLGQTGSSGLNGALVFNSATSSNYAVTLNASGSLAATYTLTLPLNAPSTSQCLESGASIASQLAFTSCLNGLSLQAAYNGGSTINTSASGTIAVAASAVPTANILNISNTGYGVATNNINDVGINFVGGNAAVEAAGLRIDYAPGGTSGGTWDGLHIVANATGAGSGINGNGIKLDGPSSGSGGTDTAIEITTGWDIGLDINSGGMQLADMSSDPSTPSTGELKVYARTVAGRSLLKVIGPSGVSYALQPSLFQQNVVLITGGNGTSTSTYTTLGSNVTGSGTLATGSGSTSEALGNTSRIATGTTADTVSGFYTKNVYYLGSIANGADGFFYFVRLNFNGQALTNYENSSTGANVFAGMCGTTFNTCDTTASPTTQNAAGFQFMGLRPDTNFQFLTCNTSACNLINTGVTVTNTDTYDMYVYVAPQGTTMYWRIDDLTAGTAPVQGSTTTDLPTGSGAVNAGLQIENLSAANRFIYFQRMYFETDR